ncbi:LamG domain-containing protein [Gaoshiqia sediminis]|uniref:LamG domain-containing protein n=1 Tax=Gaoshiqia sediminis TaxID=2986998 RepID=A0AA42C7Z1_9BACT|nr:LamG domain-containing protein [Gaoshiqia sediminis]MCW0484069.1 LamG domain-containing protein [Gaoshiqia sediminis]
MSSTLLNNAVCWLDFEGTSGAVVDSSGNGHDGTNYGADRGITGKVGNAFQFDGANGDYVDIPSDAAFNITAALTMAAWVYPTGAGFQIVAGIPYSTSGHSSPYFSFSLQLATHDASNVYARIFASTPAGMKTSPKTTGVYVPLNQWSLIIATFEGDAVRAYVNDGAAASTAFSATTLNTYSNPLWVGKNGGGGEQLEGKLCQFILWDRVLTSGERTELWNSGDGVSHASLAGGGLTASEADGVTASDSLTKAVSYVRSLSDAVTVSDVISNDHTGSTAHSKSLTDTVNASDVISDNSGSNRYKINGISLAGFGILPLREKGNAFALSGALDFPRRKGTTERDWGTEIEAFVSAGDLEWEGRDITFRGLMRASSHALLVSNYGDFSDLCKNDELVFSTPFGSFNVVLEKEIKVTELMPTMLKFEAAFTQQDVSFSALTTAATGGAGTLIDGYNLRNDFGIIVQSHSGYFDLAKRIDVNTTGNYKQSGYRDMRNVTLQCLLIGSDLSDMLVKMAQFQALLASPGLHILTSYLGDSFSFYVKDGLQVSQMLDYAAKFTLRLRVV